MVDTLKRLGGPSVMEKQYQSPTALYTPGAGVIAAVKHAIIQNSGDRDALAFISTNAMSTRANRHVNGLLVPSMRTIIQPLDIIVSNAASDVVRARQTPAYRDIFANAPSTPTPAAVTSGTGNAGAASSVATGSWTEVNGSLYLLSVAWKKSGGAGTISSFTDTHAGISWQLVESAASADNTQKVAVYVGVSTGTTATTTTVTFSASQDGSAAIVTLVGNTGTFDSTDTNGVGAVTGWLASDDARVTTTPKYGPHAPSNGFKVVSVAQFGTATAHTAASGWTEINDISTNQSFATAYTAGDGTGQSVYTPTLGAANGVSCAVGVEIMPRERPLTISLYGVESA